MSERGSKKQNLVQNKIEIIDSLHYDQWRDLVHKENESKLLKVS